jgi:NTP pyrophosphatase (non-canonical NTP hydrolase)
MSNQKINEAVDWFSELMREELSEKAHKNPDGWRGAHPGYLFTRLVEEVGEVAAAYAEIDSKDDIESFIMELVDVANFAMMLADNSKGLIERGLADGLFELYEETKVNQATQKT